MGKSQGKHAKNNKAGLITALSNTIISISLGVFIGYQIFVNTDRKQPPITPTLPADISEQQSIPVERLVTDGGTQIEGSIPLSGEYKKLKEQGIESFSKGDYINAMDKFEAIRKMAMKNWNRNIKPSSPTEKIAMRSHMTALIDPEILIYLNNARARKNAIRKNGVKVSSIAVVAPLSVGDPKTYHNNGQPFTVGQQMLFAAAQAQDQLYEQDNDRFNLEIIIANDLNDPEYAKKIADYLTVSKFDKKTRSILAVLGHYTSAVSCAVLPIYSKANLTFLGPISTKSDIRKTCKTKDNVSFVDNNKVFFRTISSTEFEAKSLIDYVLNVRRKSQGGIKNPSIAIFYNPNEEFSNDLYKQFKEQFDKSGLGKIEDRLIFDLSASDFKPSNALSMAESANILAVFPDGQTASSNMKEGLQPSDTWQNSLDIIRLNKGKKLILGSNPLYRIESLNQLNPEDLTNKLIIATDSPVFCISTDFNIKTNTYWYGDANRLYTSYEAMQVLINALKVVNPSRASVRKSVEKTDILSDVFKDGRNIMFDDSGDRKFNKDIKPRHWVTPYNKGGPDQKVEFGLVDKNSCNRLSSLNH